MATTRNIQSIERALKILEIFKADKREYSVKEISEEVDLSKSTAFGIINTLANHGYLEQNNDNLKYALGLKVLSLSNAVQKNNILVQTLRPYLQKMTQEFQETTYCAVEDNGSVIYIDKIEAVRSVYVNTGIGTKNYMHCTGVGKCLLAHMTEEKAEKLINEMFLKQMTYNTITDKKDLKKELIDIRNKGFSMDNEELEIGLTCVAMPILNMKKEPIAAISLSGATNRLLEKNIQDIVKSMREITDKVSRELNY